MNVSLGVVRTSQAIPLPRVDSQPVCLDYIEIVDRPERVSVVRAVTPLSSPAS